MTTTLRTGRGCECGAAIKGGAYRCARHVQMVANRRCPICGVQLTWEQRPNMVYCCLLHRRRATSRRHNYNARIMGDTPQ